VFRLEALHEAAQAPSRSSTPPSLKDRMASSPANLLEAVMGQDPAHVPPDRTRSLANGNFELRDENLSFEASFDFRRVGGFEESSSASVRFARASSTVSPWLAISSSDKVLRSRRPRVR